MHKLIITIIGIILCLPVYAQYKPVKRVLILNSYHQGFSWSDNEIKGAMDTLSRYTPYDIQITIEHMDTKLNDPKVLEPVIFNRLNTKYAHRRIDVIISFDDNAFNFLLKHRDKIFIDTPIVFAGVNNYSPDSIKGYPKITGVAEHLPYKENMDMIRQVHPNVEWIIHVTDNTYSGRLNHEAFSEFSENYSPLQNVKIGSMTDWTLLEFDNFIEKIAKQGNTVLFITDFFRDRLGNPIRADFGPAYLDTVDFIPIYSHAREHLAGVTGGAVLSGYKMGALVADIALQILQGVPPRNIPVIEDPPYQHYFRFDKLALLDIPRSRLPEDSIIIGEPEPFLQENRYIVVGFSVMVIIQVLLGIAFLISRRTSEEENATA